VTTMIETSGARAGGIRIAADGADVVSGGGYPGPPSAAPVASFGILSAG